MLPRKRKLNENNTKQRSCPKYAVLKLLADTDCASLLQFALSRGIVDISFVSHPREYFATFVDVSDYSQPSQDGSVGEQTISDAFVVNNTTGDILNKCADNEVANASVMDEATGDSDQMETEDDSLASAAHLNDVLSTLFGKQENTKISNQSRNDSPPPVIPGTGQVTCKLCGISVSCKKITNLSAHALKIHCPVALWVCPLKDCGFEHADFGRVRSHIRTTHSDLEESPKDNRNSETVAEAQKYLSYCYPSVDWATQYANLIPTLSFTPRECRQTSDIITDWEALVIDDTNRNTPVQCGGCGLTVALNKRSIEDHVKTVHLNTRPYQCGVCEYSSPDEWKVRVHISIRHPEIPFVNVFTVAAHQRPHLFIRDLFPAIAASLPEDEIDQIIRNLRASSASIPPSPSSILLSNSTVEPITPMPLPDSAVATHQLGPSQATSLKDSPSSLSSVDPVQNLFLNILNSSSINSSSGIKRHIGGRVDRMGSKVDCAMCKASVEAKRTMLVSHAKSHCPQRQWQCPHCETSAAFHSKLKLHVQNAHKSDSEPVDMYSPELENKWLELFRQCFPQFANQCYVEEWKFRSKQQQHGGSQFEDWLNRSLDSGEQARRSILIEGDLLEETK